MGIDTSIICDECGKVMDKDEAIFCHKCYTKLQVDCAKTIAGLEKEIEELWKERKQ